MRPLLLRPARGFTLIELMTAVAVLAIVMGLAAPAFRSLLEAQRMRAAAFDMMADLVLARSEALKRGNNVTLAPAASGWSSGWSVTAGTEVLSSKNTLGSGVSFTTSPASVTFDRNGRVSSSTAVVRFALSNSDASRQRCISLDPSGRPKSTTTSCPSP